MEFYLSDLKEYIGSLHQADSYALFFKKYKIAVYENEEYLIGLESIKKSRPAQYDSPALLLAFIGLVQPPLPPYFRSSNKEPMKKAVPDKKIISFCKKFGMPYSGIRPKEFYPAIDDLVHDLAVVPNDIIDLEQFRYRVAWLYTRFQVWYELYLKEEKDYVKEYIKRVGETDRSVAKQLLALEVTARMDNARLISRYDRKKDKFILGVRAQSLFDVAYFHLGNLLTMNDEHIKQHLKTCKNPRCRRLFWALHGHQKYCEFCDRRTVHKQQKGGS